MTAQEAVDKGHDIARETDSSALTYVASVIDHDENDRPWKIEFRRSDRVLQSGSRYEKFHVWEFAKIIKVP